MSLAQLAQHLQSQGRGDDKLLVHMTPAEVGGLQTLAMAHGGSLTINPQTGLPEAGFLSSILPTIIGAGVGIATMNPMLGAAAGGAAGMAMNDGSLKAGLMAGLSSYGMGSLGVGIAGAGAASSSMAGTLGQAGLTEAMNAGLMNAGGTLTDAGASALMGMGESGATALAPEAMGFVGASNAINPVVNTPSLWDNIRSGASTIGQTDGGWGQFLKSNMMPAGMAGAGLLGAMNSSSNTQSQAPDSVGYIRPFDVNTNIDPSSAYSPGTANLTRTLTPQEPVPADEWGSRSFADGGIARLASGGRYGDSQYTYTPSSNTNISNRYGVTGNTPLFEGDIAGNQGLVGQTPQYLLPQNNPSNIFGTAFNPYVPFGFQEFGQNRYGPPTAQTNMPMVEQYNQQLAEQANLEYNGQPQLAAFLSQQRAELERLYKDILGRKPDAASQKNYLEKLNAGASMDQIKQQMIDNPPPVPTVSPTTDTTPNQNPYQPTQAPVESPYGQPAATETAAADNRAAVEEAARQEALKVAEQQAAERLRKDAEDRAAQEALRKAEEERQRIAQEEAARRAQEEAARIAAEQAAAERARQEAAARAAQEAAAERARQEAAARAAQEAEQLRQAQIAEQQRQAAAAAEAEIQRQAQAAAAAEAERQAAAAAAEAQRQAELRAAQERELTQRLGYNPHSQSGGDGGGSTYAGAFTLPDNQEESLDQYYLRTLGYNPLANSGGGNAAGGLMQSYAAGGGIGMLPRYNLGGYSDGGRLLKGPGDGVSDNIPAVIGDKQPARLADGEFVIPARIVSEIGNGSTDAGAKRLYAMMDKIQKARKKSVGKGKVAVDSKAYKHLPE